MRPSLATDRISLGFWQNINFVVNYRGVFRSIVAIAIDLLTSEDRYFPLNHSGASAATVFTIPTTFGITHARCYTRTERATQSATRVGSSLLDSHTVPSTPLRPQNCLYFQSDLSCLYKLNCNIFNHHDRLYFSLHRPAPAIGNFFWLVVL